MTFQFPRLGQKRPKLDTLVDIKFPNDLYSAFIFSKIISHKLSNGSSGDLYLRFRMNFVDNLVQSQAPKFMNLGFLAINALD